LPSGRRGFFIASIPDATAAQAVPSERRSIGAAAVSPFPDGADRFRRAADNFGNLVLSVAY
ncbi:hypothetical protein, partial [Rhodovulum sulfidophilum]|uniref:hypothetical protein n=1 Tax=Rhodovulum sulfidophilum TaxID=35806 RepID=UPI001F3DC1C2